MRQDGVDGRSFERRIESRVDAAAIDACVPDRCATPPGLARRVRRDAARTRRLPQPGPLSLARGLETAGAGPGTAPVRAIADTRGDRPPARCDHDGASGADQIAAVDLASGIVDEAAVVPRVTWCPHGPHAPVAGSNRVAVIEKRRTRNFLGRQLPHLHPRPSRAERGYS